MNDTSANGLKLTKMLKAVIAEEIVLVSLRPKKVLGPEK